MLAGTLVLRFPRRTIILRPTSLYPAAATIRASRGFSPMATPIQPSSIVNWETLRSLRLASFRNRSGMRYPLVAGEGFGEHAPQGDLRTEAHPIAA